MARLLAVSEAASFWWMSREVRHCYGDPVDLIWLHAAASVGLRVQRSDEVFASYDGAGTLTLCDDAHFDADDSLAQLVFHELCHALVRGDDALSSVDWGMENVDARDLEQEHACHRLQASLADAYGLRPLFAVTTDHRSYWDALPIDPLGPGDDPAIPLARAAYRRATEGPWAEPLRCALAETRRIALAVRDIAPPESLWSRVEDLHAAGFPVPRRARGSCGECAWGYATAGTLRCRHSKRPGRAGRRVRAEMPGCVRFEPRLDAAACGACGACCREAFHLVELRPKEAFATRHPELTARDGYGLHVPRPEGRCVALEGSGAAASPYRCRYYAERPRSCEQFAVGGDACLGARRVLGLSA